MKKELYLLFILLISLFAAKAQAPIRITDDSLKFGNTRCPGIWVDVPEVKIETVRSNWIKTLEKGTKSKALNTGNEITIFGAFIKDITDAPVNIFSAVNSMDSLTRLFVALELRRDEFTTKNSKEHEQLKNFVRQFAKDQYTKVAGDQLSDQESKLKDLEKELSNMRRSKEKLEKEIQSANTDISEENYKIASVRKEMSVTGILLDEKSTELSTMPEGEAKKTAQSEAKSLQKKMKEHQKAISSSENKISRANNLINDNNNAISLNLQQQEILGSKINAQRLQVSKYTEKLRTIESY